MLSTMNSLLKLEKKQINGSKTSSTWTDMNSKKMECSMCRKCCERSVSMRIRRNGPCWGMLLSTWPIFTTPASKSYSTFKMKDQWLISSLKNWQIVKLSLSKNLFMKRTFNLKKLKCMPWHGNERRLNSSTKWLLNGAVTSKPKQKKNATHQ